jgi:CHRD domain
MLEVTMRKTLAVLTFMVSALAIAVTSPASAAPAPLTPHTFTVELSPSGDPDGSGTAELTVDLRSGTVCYDIIVTGIGEPTEPAAGIGNAHIHSFSQGGAIAVDLDTEFVPVDGAEDTYQAIDCASAPRQDLVQVLLHPEDYYVNVHTTAFPGGAVQGTLG